MACISVDAVKVDLIYVEKDECVLKAMDVITTLSKHDLKSFLFLLMDVIKCHVYMCIVQKSKHELQHYLRELLYQIEPKKEVLLEIFGTLKKFNILKKFNFCKHEFHQGRSLQNLSSFWKSLYSICEEVNDDELKSINRLFFKNSNEFESLEETICKLFLREMITEENLQALSSAFHSISRFDLVEKLEKISCPSGDRTSQMEEIYHIRNPTANNPCGLAIIINQEEFTPEGSGIFNTRIGSSKDRDRLTTMWKSFGFHTEVHDNLKEVYILDLFKNLKSRTEHYDIFVACLLSHGHEGVIYGSDGKEVCINNLVNLVAKECPSFNDKPKLFFIQACQEYDAGTRDNERPTGADVYVAISTVPGNVSYRDCRRGSFFVSELVSELSKDAGKSDIEQVMTRVKRKVSEQQNLKQMAVTQSTLRYRVILKRLQ